MNFIYLQDYIEMSRIAQIEFDHSIMDVDHPKVILATGVSPLGLYRNLVSSNKSYQKLFVIKLDEWMGIPMDHPSTCECFLKKEFISPLQIPSNQFLSMNSNAISASEECRRVSSKIDELSSIELCILGLGENGHLGLNEPSDELSPFCHTITLEKSTQSHPMLKNCKTRITQGMTLGIAEIFKAKKILLLISGDRKQNAYRALKKRKLTPQFPASLLWLHPHVTVLINNQSVI